MHQVGYLQGSHQGSTKHEILKRSSNLLQSPQQHKKKKYSSFKTSKFIFLLDTL